MPGNISAIYLLILLLSTAVSISAAPKTHLHRFEYSEVAMGVRTRIMVYAPNKSSAEHACRKAYERIAYLEDVMSDYRPTSELMQLCSKAGGPAVPVTKELFHILQKSQELAHKSDGAFDVTVGPMVKLWRKARKSGTLPSQEEIQAAQKLVGWRKVIVDREAKTVRLETPGMQLDLGAIAKGYACDEALRVLRENGLKAALVEMGGDIAVGEPPPGKKGWEIKVENASDPKYQLLLLSNSAVSSSGDTEQFVEIAGKRYSHIVDPRTGIGLTNRTAVTVIAPDCTTSDGISTAISVMGKEKGHSLAQTFPGVTAYIRTVKDTGELTVDDLKCEYRSEPLGVDVPNPRLSWLLRSKDRGVRQSAYQILAASTSEKLAAGKGDLWDSGKVVSSDSTQVPYAGRPLAANQRVYWRVRVWDGTGRPSPWSKPAYWQTGMLNPSDWKAQWITLDNPASLPIFRREFNLQDSVKRATVYVCGLGHYELRINGRKVGDNVLDPGWTDYADTCLYSTYDVTSLLKAGRNAVGIMLGNGMYNVLPGRYNKFTGSYGPPKAIFQLEIEYRSGSGERVVSDGSWQAAPGPITFSGVYGGEDYDARLEQAGWDKPGFKGSGWLDASVTQGPGGVLRSQSTEPLKVREVIKPVSVVKTEYGYLYDLGQNFSGWVRIRVKGPGGAIVRLTPGERLKDGRVDQSQSGGPSYFQYTLKGTGSEEWSPRFSYYGFRWVQADVPEAVVIESLQGEVIYPDTRRVGSFECSDPLINKIHSLIDWAIISNYKSILTDCPHREKLGWLEEYHLMGPSITYNHDLSAHMAKLVRDMRDAQHPNGMVPTIAPQYTVFQGGFLDTPEWGSAYVICPWQAYLTYGDKRILQDNYEGMKRYIQYLGTKAKDHIVDYGLGDWADVGPNPPMPQNTPVALSATAIYYYDVKIVEQTARVLRKQEEAGEFARLASDIRTAFNRKFFNTETQQYGTGSQASNGMALWMGLVERKNIPAVVENLVKDVEKHGWHTTAGDVGHRFVLQALANAGRSDVVLKMTQQTDHPSYGYQIAHGATSLTEAWDGPTRGWSQNHFMLGHIEEWFYRGLLGIDQQPGSVGYKKILIKPQIVGDLEWAKGHFDSVYGRISTHWQKQKDKLTIRTVIPPNTTALVYVSAKDASQVTEGGIPASSAEKVKFLRMEGSSAVFAVGSGEYTFTSIF